MELKRQICGLLIFFTILLHFLCCAVDNEIPESRGNKSHTYIYYPYYEIFYDIPAAEWIYKNDGALVYTSTLPQKYANVNFKKVYKMRLPSYKTANPFDLLPTFKRKYPNEIGKDTFFEIAAPPPSLPR